MVSRAGLLLALGVLSGAPASRGERTTRTSPPRPLFHGGARGVSVGPPPRGTGSGSAEDCGACHREIAQQWSQSQHRIAWSDPVFQAAYQIEPMAFCRNCHAPIAPAGRLPRGLAAHDGISCAVCHVREGAVLGSGHGRGDAQGERAPHRVRADARFEQSGFCAPCHQFNFPAEAVLGGQLFDSHAPMQDTFGEWSRSAHARAGTSCQDCHMPWRTAPDGTRYRDHGFPGGRDPALLARAATVTVTAQRIGSNGRVLVRTQVQPADVGHAFPTGDLFRRVELTVWIEDEPHGAQVFGYARAFEDRLERFPNGALGFVRREAADCRVHPPGMGASAPRDATFDRVDARRTRVRWKLEHLLMPSPQAASQGFAPALNRLLVQEGSAPITP
jgi:hypothetical protein